jgi:hypothetical protein
MIREEAQDLWRLSPSDLTFLWNECRRCFYLKVAGDLPRPRQPMPAIFLQIDRLMTAFFQDQPTSALSQGLPAGVVSHGQKWVESRPVTFPHHSHGCYLRGRLDTILAFDDGSYAVVDYKTSRPRPYHVSFYGRQLHAYAYALEHAAAGKLHLTPVSRLGLLVFEPSALDRISGGQLGYLGDVTWLEVGKDYDRFLAFLDEVLTVLERPTPPAGKEGCPWCAYRDAARASGW